MTKIAVFPGSFDPVTLGHINIIERALPLFDQIIIGIGHNSTKSGFFSLEQRVNWLQEIFLHEKKVQIHAYEGLTIDFCRRNHAQFLLRGLRSTADYNYELAIAQTNKSLAPEIETYFLMSDPAHAHINSSIVREVYKNGGDISSMVPQIVISGN